MSCYQHAMKTITDINVMLHEISLAFLKKKKKKKNMTILLYFGVTR